MTRAKTTPAPMATYFLRRWAVPSGSPLIRVISSDNSNITRPRGRRLMLLFLVLVSWAVALGVAFFLGPSAAQRIVRKEVGAAMKVVPLSMASRVRSPLASGGGAVAASGLGAAELDFTSGRGGGAAWAFLSCGAA